MRGVGILLGMMFLLLVPVMGEPTLVKDIYMQEFTVDATSYPYDSCNIESNYLAGNCQYLYACYMIIPQGALDVGSAVQKDCYDITDTKKKTFTVSFAPPRGHKWAVVIFLSVINNVYNPVTYTWDTTVDIPLDYRDAEELISLCDPGKMLRKGVCYDYQAVCIDTMNTNICQNPYDLYALNYGHGFDFDNIASFCADRDKDEVCDETESLTCPDTNGNGICDVDDIYIQDSVCIDNNQNGICDDVETEGVFCRTFFDPFHCGTGTSCISYPNLCFCEASGCSDCESGTCAPLYMSLCNTNADCPPPCQGVSGICQWIEGKGQACHYSGECSPKVIMCSVDADCEYLTPCIGVSLTCSTDNHCVAHGSCITAPPRVTTIWDAITDIFNSFLAWIAGKFGW